MLTFTFLFHKYNTPSNFDLTLVVNPCPNRARVSAFMTNRQMKVF